MRGGKKGLSTEPSPLLWGDCEHINPKFLQEGQEGGIETEYLTMVTKRDKSCKEGMTSIVGRSNSAKTFPAIKIKKKGKKPGTETGGGVLKRGWPANDCEDTKSFRIGFPERKRDVVKTGQKNRGNVLRRNWITFSSIILDTKSF